MLSELKILRIYRFPRLYFCNRFSNKGVIVITERVKKYEDIEAIKKMQTQSVEFYSNINPLVGLSAKTLRLYSALEVFRGKSDSLDKPEWFQTPNRDELLAKVGFSKTEIDKGITELIDAELLQIQNRNSAQWYCLK